MRFKNPLIGPYEKINVAFLRERSHREDDPRKEFYKAMLENDSFDAYYRSAGEEDVFPSTYRTGPVNADREIKYALKRGWIIAR